MKRRRFLQAAATGTAALWLRRAFGDVCVKTPPGGLPAKATPDEVEHGHLAEALARARAAGKPLLVIVIPADESEKHERGTAFGELLNYGSDEQLAPFAVAEVVCATPAELHAVATVDGEPLLVRIDPKGGVRTAAAVFPRRVENGKWIGDDKGDAFVDKRMATLAGHLHDLLGATTGPRAKSLSDEVRARKRAPAGSHWARSSMCGYPSVEDLPDDESMSVDCGMGHIPARSERFLYFYTKSPTVREGERFRASSQPTPPSGRGPRR